jgi:FMN reductase (NADPH)
MIQSIMAHRSIRKFKPEPVDQDILNSILEAGTRASTTGNMQVYSIVVSTQQEIKQKLWEAHFKQNMVLEAPINITFCADFNRFSKWCLENEANPGYDNFLSFITAAIDVLLVSQNIALAAESKGLGICYLGTAVYNADKLIDTLDLPKLVVPVTSMVMGYPDEFPSHTDRLPLSGVVHYEKYTNYTTQTIHEIYKEKEASTLTKELLKINGKKTLAQIFTDNRYTKKDNLIFSQKYLEVLKLQGFLNQGV